MTPFPADADEDIDETVKPADLPTDDGVPMDSVWHRYQMNLFIESLETRWAGRKDFYTGGNMFLHFSVRRHRNRDYLGPDFFVVLDTDHDRDRQYWATWDENGRFPNFIAEFLSPTTEANDRGRKKDLYEQTFRTPEYFLFDEFRHAIEGYRLAAGVYQVIPPAADGRVWSEQLGCGFGFERCQYLGQVMDFVRMYEADGTRIPTSGEAARGQAETQRRRAAAAARRADRQEQRADALAAAADAEKQRADALAAAADAQKQRADALAAAADAEKRRADALAAAADAEKHRAEAEKRRADTAVAELAAMRAELARLRPPTP